MRPSGGSCCLVPRPEDNRLQNRTGTTEPAGHDLSSAQAARPSGRPWGFLSRRRPDDRRRFLVASVPRQPLCRHWLSWPSPLWAPPRLREFSCPPLLWRLPPASSFRSHPPVVWRLIPHFSAPWLPPF